MAPRLPHTLHNFRRHIASALLMPFICTLLPSPSFALRGAGLEENAERERVASLLNVPPGVPATHPIANPSRPQAHPDRPNGVERAGVEEWTTHVSVQVQPKVTPRLIHPVLDQINAALFEGLTSTPLFAPSSPLKIIFLPGENQMGIGILRANTVFPLWVLVLNEAIANSVDGFLDLATATNTPYHGEISTRVKRVKKGWILELTDNGPGIPKKVLTDLFHREHPGGAKKDGTKRLGTQGRGVFLYTTAFFDKPKGVLKKYGGRIEIDTRRATNRAYRLIYDLTSSPQIHLWKARFGPSPSMGTTVRWFFPDTMLRAFKPPPSQAVPVDPQTELEVGDILYDSAKPAQKYVIEHLQDTDFYEGGGPKLERGKEYVHTSKISSDGVFRDSEGRAKKFRRGELNGWWYERLPVVPASMAVVPMRPPAGWRLARVVKEFGPWPATMDSSWWDHVKPQLEPFLHRWSSQDVDRIASIARWGRHIFDFSDYEAYESFVRRSARPGGVIAVRLIAFGNPATRAPHREVEVVFQGDGDGIEDLGWAMSDEALDMDIGLSMVLSSADEVAVHSNGKVWVMLRRDSRRRSTGRLLKDAPRNRAHAGVTLVARIGSHSGLEEWTSLSQERKGLPAGRALLQVRRQLARSDKPAVLVYSFPVLAPRARANLDTMAAWEVDGIRIAPNTNRLAVARRLKKTEAFLQRVARQARFNNYRVYIREMKRQTVIAVEPVLDDWFHRQLPLVVKMDAQVTLYVQTKDQERYARLPPDIFPERSYSRPSVEDQLAWEVGLGKYTSLWTIVKSILSKPAIQEAADVENLNHVRETLTAMFDVYRDSGRIQVVLRAGLEDRGTPTQDGAEEVEVVEREAFATHRELAPRIGQISPQAEAAILRGVIPVYRSEAIKDAVGEVFAGVPAMAKALPLDFRDLTPDIPAYAIVIYDSSQGEARPEMSEAVSKTVFLVNLADLPQDPTKAFLTLLREAVAFWAKQPIGGIVQILPLGKDHVAIFV